MKKCYLCGSCTTICCDVFNRWMCPSCAVKWMAHCTEVIGTADGKPWCHEERTDSAAAEAVAQDQAAEAGSRCRLMEGTGMLVLSRRLGEAIMIGDDVVIEVCQIKCNVVKIGIAAPKDTRVLRSEIKERDNARDTND